MVQMNCDANIFGMLVHHDDVIHADFHGAVVIPADAVRKLPAAIDLVSRREGYSRCHKDSGFQQPHAARRAETFRRNSLMSKPPLRVGVIGCGFFAENHLAAWQHMPDVTLTAVCDLDSTKAQSAAERYDTTGLRFPLATCWIGGSGFRRHRDHNALPRRTR